MDHKYSSEKNPITTTAMSNILLRERTIRKSEGQYVQYPLESEVLDKDRAYLKVFLDTPELGRLEITRDRPSFSQRHYTKCVCASVRVEPSKEVLIEFAKKVKTAWDGDVGSIIILEAFAGDDDVKSVLHMMHEYIHIHQERINDF
jgi:hypothetical protein